MVATRGSGKRAVPAADAAGKTPKKRQRRDQTASSPKDPSAQQSTHSKPKPSPLPKGRRGAALLAVVGVQAPALPQEGLPSLASPLKGAPSPSSKRSPASSSPSAAKQHPRPQDRIFLRQELPKSYVVLQDFFAALQLNYSMLRKRGQRCTYQSLRAAVEEQTSKRFLVGHLAQLQFLLPDVIALDWVRLPVAPHSSRTEPHLAIALGALPDCWDHPVLGSTGGAPAHAAPKGQRQQQREEEVARPVQRGNGLTADGPAPDQQQPASLTSRPGSAAAVRASRGAGSDGEVTLLRQLLHYRLARHLLAAYRRHLQREAVRLRKEDSLVEAEELERLAAAVPSGTAVASGSSSTDGCGASSSELQQGRQQQQHLQPVTHFAAGFLESAGVEVPQQPLPRRPDPAGPAASPAAVASHLQQPATPATAQTSGRPPLPPPSAARMGHRRLSFTAAAAPALAPAVPSTLPRPALPFKSTKAGGTPLDKLEKQLNGATPARSRGLAASPADFLPQQTSQHPQHAQQDNPQQEQQQLLLECSEGEQEPWSGRILSEEEWVAANIRTEEDARVWGALPHAAKRLSVEGIMSFEAHRAVDAAARRHEIISSKVAVEARALRSALGMLPKTYMRLQRIFGMTGPNALKLQQVYEEHSKQLDLSGARRQQQDKMNAGGGSRVLARLRSSDETHSESEYETQLQLLAEHAPECCSLRPYGSCGTPAVWWDRRADNASAGGILRRLKGAAEARHSPAGAHGDGVVAINAAAAGGAAGVV
ncbi:hypothetical protein N2152v2_004884 [Parachlorella kessleri]